MFPKTSLSTFHALIGVIVHNNRKSAGSFVIHSPLGHVGAHHMHEKNPVCKSISRLAIGAAGPSRDPAAVKRNDVQELAVEIPVCQERKYSRAHPTGEKKNNNNKKTATPSCRASVGPYNASSIFALTSLGALLCCRGSNLYISPMRICVGGGAPPALLQLQDGQVVGREKKTCLMSEYGVFRQIGPDLV